MTPSLTADHPCRLLCYPAIRVVFLELASVSYTPLAGPLCWRDGDSAPSKLDAASAMSTSLSAAMSRHFLGLPTGVVADTRQP